MTDFEPDTTTPMLRLAQGMFGICVLLIAVLFAEHKANAGAVPSWEQAVHELKCDASTTAPSAVKACAALRSTG